MAGLLVLLAVIAAGTYALSPHLLRWLRWTYADPLAGRLGLAPGALAGLATAFLALITLNDEQLREHDP